MLLLRRTDTACILSQYALSFLVCLSPIPLFDFFVTIIHRKTKSKDAFRRFRVFPVNINQPKNYISFIIRNIIGTTLLLKMCSTKRARSWDVQIAFHGLSTSAHALRHFSHFLYDSSSQQSNKMHFGLWYSVGLLGPCVWLRNVWYLQTS